MTIKNNKTKMEKVNCNHHFTTELQKWMSRRDVDEIDVILGILELKSGGTSLEKYSRVYRRLRGDYSAADFVKSNEPYEEFNRTHREEKLRKFVYYSSLKDVIKEEIFSRLNTSSKQIQNKSTTIDEFSTLSQSSLGRSNTLPRSCVDTTNNPSRYQINTQGENEGVRRDEDISQEKDGEINLIDFDTPLNLSSENASNFSSSTSNLLTTLKYTNSIMSITQAVSTKMNGTKRIPFSSEQNKNVDIEVSDNEINYIYQEAIFKPEKAQTSKNLYENANNLQNLEEDDKQFKLRITQFKNTICLGPTQSEHALTVPKEKALITFTENTQTSEEADAARNIMGPIRLQIASSCSKLLQSFEKPEVCLTNAELIPTIRHVELPFELAGTHQYRDVIVMRELDAKYMHGNDLTLASDARLHPQEFTLPVDEANTQIHVELEAVKANTAILASLGLADSNKTQQIKLQELLEKEIFTCDSIVGCISWAEHDINVKNAKPMEQCNYPALRKFEVKHSKIPKEKRQKLTRKSHNAPTSGHFGRLKPHILVKFQKAQDRNPIDDNGNVVKKIHVGLLGSGYSSKNLYDNKNQAEEDTSRDDQELETAAQEITTISVSGNASKVLNRKTRDRPRKMRVVVQRKVKWCMRKKKERARIANKNNLFA